MSWHQTKESLVGFINCVNIHAALSGNLVRISLTCIPLIMTHLEPFPSHGCHIIIEKLINHYLNHQSRKVEFENWQPIPRRILRNALSDLNIAVS